jgi:DNA-binding NtrC family response regulator
MKDITSEEIIIIDDEKEITASYSIFLKRNGFKNFFVYNNPLKLKEDLKKYSPAVIFLDLSMPDMTGEELLENIMDTYSEVSVIVLTGTDDVDTAVRCIKKGALDYMVKPIDKNRFTTALEKGVEIFRMRNELYTTRKKLIEQTPENIEYFREIITREQSMINIFKYIEAVSKGDQPVLITGETGTGKELISKAVHYCSGRKGEFIPVNLSGLDEAMFNDTLFGHAKGAYTGAEKNRSGLLAAANNGTIFLDEIGDMEESSQVKLLRFLQDKQYTPLGMDSPVKSNAKIVAATNADLEQKVKTGEFRQDLFYRLKTHTVKLPPLRERKEDIPLLADKFFNDNLRKIGIIETSELPEALLNSVKKHPFPGNIRELQSIITDYTFMFQNNHIKKNELKFFLEKHSIKPVSQIKGQQESLFSYSGDFPSLKEMEETLVKKAMEITNGNQSQAAKLLGISRQAMNKRIKN